MNCQQQTGQTVLAVTKKIAVASRRTGAPHFQICPAPLATNLVPLDRPINSGFSKLHFTVGQQRLIKLCCWHQWRKTFFWSLMTLSLLLVSRPNGSAKDAGQSLVCSAIELSAHTSWRRGSVVRMSVCSRRTFPDLRLIQG